MKCRAEPNGLHEVNVRFEDEKEYIGRAIDDDRYADQRSSTRVAGHPVILSVLFDDAGTSRACASSAIRAARSRSAAWRHAAGLR